MKTKLLTLLVFLSSGWVAADTHYTLTYQQQELQSPSGVAAIYQRIELAALTACPDYRQTPGLRAVRERKACVEDVINALVAKVDHDALRRHATSQPRKSTLMAARQQP